MNLRTLRVVLGLGILSSPRKIRHGLPERQVASHHRTPAPREPCRIYTRTHHAHQTQHTHRHTPKHTSTHTPRHTPKHTHAYPHRHTVLWTRRCEGGARVQKPLQGIGNDLNIISFGVQEVRNGVVPTTSLKKCVCPTPLVRTSSAREFREDVATNNSRRLTCTCPDNAGHQEYARHKNGAHLEITCS